MLVTLLLLATAGSFAPGFASVEAPALPTLCWVTDGPAYYEIELFTTKNVPGTGFASGAAAVSVSAASPFSVALTADGSYAYDVHISFERLRAPAQGHLVAWVTTSDLSRIERIGPLDEHLQANGSVAWNQFLVVVTLEPTADPSQMWNGPIAFRGMSRSGMMHTMVGHGALQQENCAAYGYRE